MISSFRLFTSHFINQEIDPFNYVETNGLKIAEPVAAYNISSGKGYWDMT